MVTALAARHVLPAIFPFREYALAGGLMSYGSSLGYLHHEWGIYSGRILKGEKPEPICRSSRPLTLNLKTAKALPAGFQSGRADLGGMCPLKYVMQPSFFSNANSLVMWVTPVGNIGR
jgi:putative tryptophan/tyrosine transport system substrate-binding protein